MAGSLLLASGIGLWGIASRTSSSPSVFRRAPTGAAAAGGAARSASVAALVAPAVVDINTYASAFGSGFAGGSRLAPLGAGTGMILTSSGEVLTNNHVVQGATSIKVTVAGHSGSFTASVIGTDPSDDVALLQLQGASGLPTVTVGDPAALTVGEHVVAIGNALGRGGAPAVAAGTVSGLHRSITARDQAGVEHLGGLIQTDAKIKPGDSGGPLVDPAGKVVGMITAGATGGTRRATTVGFAIPTDVALGIVGQIRAGHASSTILLGERGYLGVVVQPLESAIAARLGLTPTAGALVTGVQPGGPAAAAGIKAPAVITAIDGVAIASFDALGSAIHAHAPGEQIRVTWVDASGTHTATANLIAGPAV